MILSIIIGIVLGVGCAISLCKEDCYIIGDYILYILVSAVLAFVIIIIGLAGSALIGESLDTTYMLEYSAPIVALKDDKIMQGDFFLGCGSVDGDLQYYYAEDSSKGYKVKHVGVDNTYLLFDDDKPRIERYEAAAFNKKRHYLYAMPNGYYYKIYIPHGSITNEFKVDLE